jgi:hypothetical protein
MRDCGFLIPIQLGSIFLAKKSFIISFKGEYQDGMVVLYAQNDDWGRDSLSIFGLSENVSFLFCRCAAFYLKKVNQNEVT